jgi:hypothetical protein
MIRNSNTDSKSEKRKRPWIGDLGALYQNAEVQSFGEKRQIGEPESGQARARTQESLKIVSFSFVSHFKAVLIKWRCSVFVRQDVADPVANTI